MRHKANCGRVSSEVGNVTKKGYYAVSAIPTAASSFTEQPCFLIWSKPNLHSLVHRSLFGAQEKKRKCSVHTIDRHNVEPIGSGIEPRNSR